jgi:hypothetical protein
MGALVVEGTDKSLLSVAKLRVPHMEDLGEYRGQQILLFGLGWS